MNDDIFYYEVKILENGTRSTIMVGIACQDIVQNKPLGSFKGSYGYKADGKIYEYKINPQNNQPT